MPFLDNNSNHSIWVLAPYKVGIIHMSTKYSEVDGSQSMSINISLVNDGASALFYFIAISCLRFSSSILMPWCLFRLSLSFIGLSKFFLSCLKISLVTRFFSHLLKFCWHLNCKQDWHKYFVFKFQNLVKFE